MEPRPDDSSPVDLAREFLHHHSTTIVPLLMAVFGSTVNNAVFLYPKVRIHHFPKAQFGRLSEEVLAHSLVLFYITVLTVWNRYHWRTELSGCEHGWTEKQQATRPMSCWRGLAGLGEQMM